MTSVFRLCGAIIPPGRADGTVEKSDSFAAEQNMASAKADGDD